MPKQTSFTFVLDDLQQEILADLLRSGNYRPCEVPYTVVAVDAVSWKCHVNLYTSGKCLVQGAGAEDFVTSILEPMVLGTATVGYEDVLDPAQLEPHMGIDESGKGDYFGPLCIAAAYTDETLCPQLRELGVRDSKRISSDAQALRMAAGIRSLLGPRRYTVVRIGNATYNRLYAKMHSVNRLLSWGHARAIENLLTAVPTCPRAISDQFDRNGIQRSLMKSGRQIVLEQHPRAEADIAVAAASILAREAFLLGLSQMKAAHGGLEFPKGASPQTRAAAEALVRAEGPAALIQVAKCHFRTTDAVLSATGHTRQDLPEEGRVVSQDTTGRDFRRPKGGGSDSPSAGAPRQEPPA